MPRVHNVPNVLIRQERIDTLSDAMSQACLQPAWILFASVGAAACAETTIRGPVPKAPSTLEVASETIEVDYVGSQDELACGIDARTRIENPAADSDGTDLRLEASRAREMRVQIDGREVQARLTGGQVDTSLAVAPHGHRDVVMTADATLDARQFLWTKGALAVRHPWLGEDPRETTATLRICPAAEGPWGHARPTVVRVRGPSRWQFESGGLEKGPDGTVTFPDVTSCIRLRWHPRPRAIPIYHGGPLLGVGGTFGQGWRTRLGYEAGVEDWAVASLSVESDLDRTVVLAPVFEAASPSFVVIPSFGVGLGVPVRLKPDATAGIRGQVTVMWGIGAALSVDYYPSDDDWQTTLMAQIGL